MCTEIIAPEACRAVWSNATWLCMRGMGMRARCHGWWDLADVLVERLRFRSYRGPAGLARQASRSSGGERRISVRQPAPALQVLLTRRTVPTAASWAAHAGGCGARSDGASELPGGSAQHRRGLEDRLDRPRSELEPNGRRPRLCRLAWLAAASETSCPIRGPEGAGRGGGRESQPRSSGVIAVESSQGRPLSGSRVDNVCILS